MTTGSMTAEQGVEDASKMTLTIVTLGEMAMTQHVRDVLHSTTHTKPSEQCLAVLNAYTRNTKTLDGICRSLAPNYTLSAQEAAAELGAAVTAYGARTPIQATDIALARGDIPLRWREPMPRPAYQLQLVLEDGAGGMTRDAIAQKYDVPSSKVDTWSTALMQFYGNASNMPTTLRRAREVGHWPSKVTVPGHTIAGVALSHKQAVSLSSKEICIIQDQSNGVFLLESKNKLGIGQRTASGYMNSVNNKLEARSKPEMITKAILLDVLRLEYSTQGVRKLTAREKAVACGTILGLDNTALCEQLKSAEPTVKTQLRSLLGKLNADDREEAVRRLFEADYIVPSDIPHHPKTAPYCIPAEILTAKNKED
ncbi:MAG TPA: LuxR C-terminal-related transcriptional regulator [Candidatus Saccharimonadales bacterium]|nr:LuxR C-terminal-related transcriptional regulator [Candidatus Saccharimonadales bacterium]